MHFFSSQQELTDAEKSAAIADLRARLQAPGCQVLEQLRAGGEASELDDQLLSRWLRAESYAVDKAEARLKSHAAWRQAEFPQGRVLESEIEQELAADKVFLQGCDKHGRRLIVLKVKRHSVSKRNLEETMRLLCYSLDKAIALNDLAKNPEGKITGIFDLRGLTMDSIDNGALRGVFSMLQNHYPERLGTLWMYESPGIFWALWKVVSPFVDPVTRKKVIFVSEGSGVKEMEADIDLEVLPEEFGGKAKLVPIREVQAAAAIPAQAPVKAAPAVQNGASATANGASVLPPVTK